MCKDCLDWFYEVQRYKVKFLGERQLNHIKYLFFLYRITDTQRFNRFNQNGLISFVFA